MAWAFLYGWGGHFPLGAQLVVSQRGDGVIRELHAEGSRDPVWYGSIGGKALRVR